MNRFVYDNHIIKVW